MSFSAAIILRATCDSVTSLHGETTQYTFEEGARVRDLVNFTAENYALGNDYMFQLKRKTLDTNGTPKITTLLPSSLLTHGEMYYMFINARDDLELDSDPSQMVLPTPMALTSPMTPVSSSSFMTPNTSQRYRRVFGNIQSPSTSFSALSVDDAASEVTSFPVSQTSDYLDPNATPRKRSHRMQSTTITDESAGRSAGSAAEVEDVSALDSCETSASTSGSTSTDTSTETVPGGFNVLPFPLLPDHGVSKGKFLGMLYSHNQDIMDKSFAPMTKEPMLFYDINVNERMSSTPCTIAAFVLISHRGFADYDIRVGAIARDICQKFVIDLVMDVKKSNTMSRDTVRPLIKHLNGMTRGSFFDYLITPDGPLFAAIRKRESRQSASNGFIPKKRKLMFPPAPMDDVNKAANAVATAHTQEEIAAIVKSSSTARCMWIGNMVKEEKARIPELVVAKFPLFKTNASWLQYDFVYTMEKIYNLPVINVSTSLERYAPAITALARDHKLLSQDEEEDASSDLLKTCGHLLKLLGKYFKKKDTASIERLVASSHDFPSVDEMIEKRRDIKQIAPMIFIIETTHGKDYFVSTDDFALKVLGNFGDALQCLTALHYVCYIEYAKELLHFNELLENLCGINLEKMPKSRRNLKMDLDTKMPPTSSDNR